MNNAPVTRREFEELRELVENNVKQIFLVSLILSKLAKVDTEEILDLAKKTMAEMDNFEERSMN